MIDNLDLNRLVPNSIKKDNEVKNIISTVDKEVNLINLAVDDLGIYSAIDTLPMDIVQVLAWQFNVSSEDKGWLLTATDEGKRALVKNSIRLHRTKGTKYALEEALRTVGFDGVVEEWFEYSGRPYHFKINITSYRNVDEYKMKRFRGLVNEYKNARSYLEDLKISTAVKSDVPRIATSFKTTGKMTLYPYIDNYMEVNQNLNLAVGNHITVRVMLIPI